jgi:short-subunit dehydrogenase
MVAASGTYLPRLTAMLARRSAGTTSLESTQILAPEAKAENVTNETTDSGMGPGNVNAPQALHCVITGAASGIGRALAQTYGKAGYMITGVDVDAEAAMRTQADLINNGIQARFIVADLARPEHLDSIGDRLNDRPPIDVMIHCAGISAVGLYQALPWPQQEKVLRVNLYAPILLTQRLLQDRRLRQSAGLVFISSLSHYTSYPGAAVYAATKSGISSFSRSLSVALSNINVHVLTVYPGPVRTEHARRYSPDNSREQQRMDPITVAEAILAATRTRRTPMLFPGLLAKLSAWLGLWFPNLVERTMRRTILDKLSPSDKTP